MQLLLDKGTNVNAQSRYIHCRTADSFDGNALYAASEQGQTRVVKLLLDNGVSVSMQGGDHSNALQAAAKGGYEEIMKLLINKGADVNVQGRYYFLLSNDFINDNALHAASRKGHEAVVKLLLENGANPNMQGGEYGSAPLAASAGGFKQIVELLLDNGVDADTQSKANRYHYGYDFEDTSALYMAS